MSYNTLLVPVDGSKFAEHALPAALSIAHRSGAALHLVQVHVPLAMTYAYAYEGAVASLDADRTVLQAEKTHLRDLAACIAAWSNLPCTGAVVEGVGPVEALCNAARSEQADLIVMTTHGRGPLSRIWLGSVTDEVIRSAPCPVLAVRPTEGEPDWMAETPYRRIAVPLDGSPQSEYVLEAAVAMGALSNAEYHLIHVTSQQEDGQRYLDDIARRMSELASTVHTHLVGGTHVANRILEVADELGTDLIAMETHGYRGFQRWRLGSVADKVLRGASKPVLTHRMPTALQPPHLDGRTSFHAESPHRR